MREAMTEAMTNPETEPVSHPATEAARKEVARVRDQVAQAEGAAAQLADARAELDKLSRGLESAERQLMTAMQRLSGFVEQIDALDPAALDETVLTVSDRVSRIEDNVAKLERLSQAEARTQKGALESLGADVKASLRDAERKTEAVLKKVSDSVRAAHDQSMQQWDAVEGRDQELSAQLEATRKMVTAVGIFVAIVLIWGFIA